MGDPAGIGPEIVVKALAGASLNEVCRPLIIGDSALLQKTADGLGLPLTDIEIHDLKNVMTDVGTGIESADTGRASAQYIETAVELWQNGEIDAVATAPISKKALSLAGYSFPGHTEFLAELTNTRQFAMSFFAEKLRVVLLSTHISLRDAINLVKKESLEKLIKFSNATISQLLKKDIKIAVAGLNPHASEGGMFGSEEADEIIPAIRECQVIGINVDGPFSPDTIFLRGFRGEFDAVISCYHDQATIAVKSLSFGSSVNVTLGLPLIRTSVDHGTAFDIAGKGIAEESSMRAAIRLAAELVQSSNSQ
jgi:4-hydroxythreonine-4-phosphate dehydrogenase